ncbi:MAG TPA: autotransporter strand-loop-strand O-heptosyltransferase, partial [Acidisoma sp.]|nr:autotransporter strand-loop-strand O-heptosyltransferase [Acidisoma sp.]
HTPYRVINWHVCNSCWNDDTTDFDNQDRADFLWCPRHKDTPRMFECSRAITARQVIAAIRRVPGLSGRS